MNTIKHTRQRWKMHAVSDMRKQNAFTVLEIMVVIAIIGMLVGLTVANLDKLLGDSKTDLASVFVRSSIKVPLQQYSMHLGDFPTTVEGLQALITPPSNKADRWRGPYLQDGVVPLDPWKRPTSTATRVPTTRTVTISFLLVPPVRRMRKPLLVIGSHRQRVRAFLWQINIGSKVCERSLPPKNKKL